MQIKPSARSGLFGGHVSCASDAGSDHWLYCGISKPHASFVLGSVFKKRTLRFVKA